MTSASRANAVSACSPAAEWARGGHGPHRAAWSARRLVVGTDPAGPRGLPGGSVDLAQPRSHLLYGCCACNVIGAVWLERRLEASAAAGWCVGVELALIDVD